MTHGHRDFTVCSCSSLPVSLAGWASSAKCSTTSDVSGGPSIRSARAKARRRIAADRHRSSGCSHAPRPGCEPDVSTVTANCPFPIDTATTRSSTTANSRVRQPMHVRTGTVRVPATGLSRWITGQSTSPTATSEPSFRYCCRPAPSGAPGGVDGGASSSATTTSLRMSMRQPVRRAANRAFCPSLPMASDS